MNGASILAVAAIQDQSGGQFFLLRPVIMRGGLLEILMNRASLVDRNDFRSPKQSFNHFEPGTCDIVQVSAVVHSVVCDQTFSL